MVMGQKILSLRNFSLRWAIVICFMASIVVGLLSLFNGKSLGLTACVSAFTITLFYVTFAVYAIEKDEKAIVTSYVFIVAMFCSICGSFKVFNDSPDFGSMLFQDVFLDSTTMQNWAFGSVASAAPYTLLMDVLMLGGFFYSIGSIKGKFLASWVIAIIAQIVSAWGIFLVFSQNDFSTFQECNTISSVLIGILMVLLLCIGGKSAANVGGKSTVKQMTNSQIAQPQHNVDIASKSEKLMQLKSLLDSGILTQEEFDNEKKEILRD